jgi:hypothetical protein
MQKNILAQHENTSLNDILHFETNKVCYLETFVLLKVYKILSVISAEWLVIVKKYLN